MANDFRSLAGRAAKIVAEEARQRGGSLALNDEDITAFLATVVEPGEQVVAFDRFTPDLDWPKVPRGRKVDDGFGGRSATRKIAGAAIGVAAVASGEWFGDPRRSSLVRIFPVSARRSACGSTSCWDPQVSIAVTVGAVTAAF